MVLATGSGLDVLLEEHHERILARWQALAAAEPSREGALEPALRERVAAVLRALPCAVAGARAGGGPAGPRDPEHTSRGLDRRLTPSRIVWALHLLRRAILEAWTDDARAPGCAGSSSEGAGGMIEQLASLDAGIDAAVAEAVAWGASERRRAEQMLGEQLALQDQLAKVAASVPGVVCSFRLHADGHVSMPFSAPAIEDLYGFSREELARDMVPALARSPPEDVEQTRISVAESARTMTRWHQVFRYQHPTKGLRWIEGTSIPTREEGGSIIWHGYVADVTDRKRAEERIREANERLRENDRRKDEFLGMLSHELRNPLAPIRNALYILDHVEPGGPQARRAREVAARQVAHLTRLVDDLLDVTRIARGKIELRRADVDLVSVAQRAGEDHRALMEERGLALEVHTPPGPMVVNGDETRLAQVLGNLLGNAAKFTPRGGRVTLAVEEHPDRAVIRVRDDGLGIEREMLEAIFDPFTQAKQSLARTEGGLGLGLALVKGLITLHGGSVAATSEGSGRGTEFVVTLPVVRPAAAARAGAGAPAGSRTSRSPRRRVLVVDDNGDAAETLAELVQMLGHEAEIAHDGPSALALARARHPDVVLCDIGLPGMDGYAVARALRGEGLPSRLIAVSGYAQPEDLATAAAAGFERHVAKPLDPQQLAELLV